MATPLELVYSGKHAASMQLAVAEMGVTFVDSTVCRACAALVLTMHLYCVPQMAVAVYFLDRLALRAGHEKDEDEADTVGCCTLKVGALIVMFGE